VASNKIHVDRGIRYNMLLIYLLILYSVTSIECKFSLGEISEVMFCAKIECDGIEISYLQVVNRDGLKFYLGIFFMKDAFQKLSYDLISNQLQTQCYGQQ
jgi:hypothetical protein